MCQDGEKYKKIISQLKDEQQEHLQTISKLENEVTVLKSDLDKMSKSVRMINSGSDTLDQILQEGRVTGDMIGLGFNETKELLSNLTQIQTKRKMSNQMSQHHRRGNFRQSKRRF